MPKSKKLLSVRIHTMGEKTVIKSGRTFKGLKDQTAHNQRTEEMDKSDLKLLLTKKLEAKVYLDNLDYVDTYKTQVRKAGTDEEFEVEVIDAPSSLRKFLEAVGVSSGSKNDVIGKTKKASTALTNDITVLKALMAIK